MHAIFMVHTTLRHGLLKLHELSYKQLKLEAMFGFGKIDGRC